jgi:hypothetical protein
MLFSLIFQSVSIIHCNKAAVQVITSAQIDDERLIKVIDRMIDFHLTIVADGLRWRGDKYRSKINLVFPLMIYENFIEKSNTGLIMHRYLGRAIAL